MGSSPYRTLILWLIWASATIAVSLGVYNDTDIGTFMAEDETYLSWVIVGLFLFGVGVSFVLMLRLTNELLEAVHAERIAQNEGLLRITSELQRPRAVARYFEGLKAIAVANGQLNSDSLLQAELAVYQRVAHSVGVLGNLLITQGLIGTVVGLTITLSGLTGSLNALGQDQALLIQGLRQAMGGMGTAFYTTLLGAVFGGFLLRVFALITEDAVETLHDRLARITLVHCAADLKKTPDKDVRLFNAELEHLTENVKTLQAAFAATSTAMAQFRHEAERLAELGNVSEEKDEADALREAIKLQRHYRLLMKQQITLMDRTNRAWYRPIRRFLQMAWIKKQ